MEELKLPLRFKKKLDASDKKFNAIIYDILKNFEDVLNTSSLDFFPEYNNHGITHLNNVFYLQDELITDESFNLLTVEDITTLVVATLSHDIGMHLNYEGFQTLLKSSDSWREKWNSFFQKARKYNQARLELLFGDTVPVIELPETKQNFRSRDYMLVGEFLRTNHPAMAEAILNQGFPIANGKFKKLTDLLDGENKILDFSALLAKSHGMSIRSTFEEIESIGYSDNLVFSHNVHIVYLMVVLRLSDYMDIYKNRHPKVMLGVKNFMSEISKFEWGKNTAIVDENPYHKDKEAIFLGVEPKDSITFINLQRLFKGIQYELDISWAVLGEVYSRDDSLRNFSIKYRRIRTNIDDVKSFSKKVDYLARSISFDSDPELLKLLIAPLYGDNPSYGVRELLQNAVDACKELKELNNFPGYEPKISVNASKKESKYVFEIIDNGIGMTESTIVDYFLKAGASFRKSDVWRDNFEDKDHKSKVERTGRFGVGLLAAFLIGDRIEVITKHYSQDEGYIFKTQLSDSQINIKRNNSCPIGTTIRIEMKKERFEKLKKSGWETWYKLNDISIKFNDVKIQNTIIEDNYIKLNQDEYTSVSWSWNKKESNDVICNGFVIRSGKLGFESKIDIPNSGSSRHGSRLNYFKYPSLLIIDKEGKLPLDLSRDKFISNEFSFYNELLKSMSSKLFNDLSEHKCSRNMLQSKFNHPIFSNDRWSETSYENFVYCKDGFNLLSSYNISENNLDTIVFISLSTKINETNRKKRKKIFDTLIDRGAYIVLSEDDIYADSYGYSDWFNVLTDPSPSLDADGKKFSIKSAVINIPKKKHLKIFTYKNLYVNKGFKDCLITSDNEMKGKKSDIPFSEESDVWARNYYKTQTESVIDLKELDEYEDEIGLIVELNIDRKKPVEKDVEYYFYGLMTEYFKDKDNKWFPYTKNDS